ncbi:MAG TPA: histidine kinase [Solirubrobacteraceae bacterium]
MRRPRRIDWLLTALALALGLGELAVADDLRGGVALNVVFVVAIVLPMAWWRARPVAATAVLFAAAVLGAWLTSASDLQVIWLSLLALAFGLGAHADGRGALTGVGILTAGIVITTAIESPLTVSAVLFPILMTGAFYVAGRTARSRSRLAGELHEAAVRANERRAVAAERAVAEERKRIAREMHDVVAHSMSVMVVQAGGARRILERDPLRAREAAELIAATGREALVELQRLLGVLHLEPAAAPTLDGLDGLVERARAAGLPVALTVDGERRRLPDGVEHAAYRVVQEAITNAIKYAGAAPTEVRISYGLQDVELHVCDRGSGGVAPARVGGGGHGLVGMRERVRIFGGELHTGRRAGGGFEVRARIPLDGRAEHA